MPTGLPSDLYSGGSVKFDSQPFVNFYAQMKARKQAKDEALDQYYQNQFKNVNSAGMRTQDIPFFTEKVNAAQQFYQQYRDKIKNPRLDGGQAQAQFQARLTDASNTTQQSKNEAKVTQDVMPLLRDPDKRSRIPDSVITDLAIHDLPLNDPNRKSFDFGKLNFDAKPFDVTMQKNYLQGVQQGLKMNEAITGIKKNPNDFTQTVTTTASFGDEAKEAIRNRAAGAYGSDPSFKHFVDTELSKPNNYQQLNSIFKKQYGTDIAHPEDLATAWSLGAIQDEQIKQKSEANWKDQQDYRHKQAIDLLNRRQAAEKSGEKELNMWVNNYLDILDEQSKAAGMKGNTVIGPKSYQEVDIPLDPVLSKALARQGREPDYLRKTADGKYRPLFFQYDDKGNPIPSTSTSGGYKIDFGLSQPISKEQMKLALGYKGQTKKDLGQTMGGTKAGSASGYKYNGKSYSHKELNEMGYDDELIQDAIKKGLIQQ